MQESAARSWSLVDRGQFVVAQCNDCGWHSHARRAYSSVEKEAAQHAQVCADAVSPDPATASSD